jgi:hypothetical protein
MLVDTPRTLVTFRSCTTDTGYSLKADMEQGTPWLLDKAMVDCSAQVMRVFHQRLKRVD